MPYQHELDSTIKEAMSQAVTNAIMQTAAYNPSEAIGFIFWMYISGILSKRVSNMLNEINNDMNTWLGKQVKDLTDEIFKDKD